MEYSGYLSKTAYKSSFIYNTSHYFDVSHSVCLISFFESLATHWISKEGNLIFDEVFRDGKTKEFKILLK